MKKNIITFGIAVALAAAFCETGTAQITYVDATDGAGGNTTLVGGAQWGPLTLDLQGAASDGIWDKRAFGSSATIYQNSRSATTDNAHRLLTTLSLALDTYNAYAYFWDDGSSPWRMQASVTDNPGGDLPLFIGGASPSGTPTPTNAVLADFSVAPAGLTVNGSGQVVDSAGRRLWQAYLGQVTGSSLTFFIDDSSSQADQNQRTWYDGVGYSVVPEPSSLAVGAMGLGILALWLRRDRRGSKAGHH